MFIERSRYANHLGNHLGPEIEMIYEKISINLSHLLMVLRNAHVIVKYALFQSYVYASLFWVLGSSKVDTIWHKCAFENSL